jgi:hypothetical protein
MKKIAVSFILVLFGTVGFSQQLEVRFDTESQKDSEAKNSMGGGASLVFDEWIERVNFQLNFDYAYYKSEADYLGYQTKYKKLKAGASALYCFPLSENFLFRAGIDLSYNDITKLNTLKNDSTYYYVSHHGYMLGLGGIVNLQWKLGNRISVSANLIPTYLIPLSYKTDRPEVDSYYNKGFFVLQFQIGLVFRLGTIVPAKTN